MKTYVVFRNVTGGQDDYVKALTIYADWREVLKALRLAADANGWTRGQTGNHPDAPNLDDGSDWLDSLDQADAVTVPLQHLPSAGKGVQHG